MKALHNMLQPTPTAVRHYTGTSRTHLKPNEGALSLNSTPVRASKSDPKLNEVAKSLTVSNLVHGKNVQLYCGKLNFSFFVALEGKSPQGFSSA